MKMSSHSYSKTKHLRKVLGQAQYDLRVNAENDFKAGSNKIILIDPLAEISPGHNYELLKNYISLANGLSSRVYQITIKPKSAKLEFGSLTLDFPDVYSWLFKAKNKTNPRSRINAEFIFQALSRIIWYHLSLMRATSFFILLINKKDISEKDLFVLTTSDGVTLRALMIAKRVTKCSAIVNANFMNILDNLGPLRVANSQHMKNWILKTKNLHELTIFAETQNYQRFLENFLQKQVLLNRLLVPSVILANRKKVYLAGFMGGARYDKGFLTIPDIIEKLEKLFVEAEFLVQGVNQSLGPQYDEVSQILKDNPKVTFIEEKLDLDIYHAYIEECSMLILPYAQDVYEMRGSAVVSDALALQVPVIAPANLGKSKDIQDFNLGAIYENIDQIGDCIEALLLKQKKPKYEEYLESVMYDIDRFLHR